MGRQFIRGQKGHHKEHVKGYIGYTKKRKAQCS